LSIKFGRTDCFLRCGSIPRKSVCYIHTYVQPSRSSLSSPRSLHKTRGPMLLTIFSAKIIVLSLKYQTKLSVRLLDRVPVWVHPGGNRTWIFCSWGVCGAMEQRLKEAVVNENKNVSKKICCLFIGEYVGR
jgi:hypothetical protein